MNYNNVVFETSFGKASQLMDVAEKVVHKHSRKSPQMNA